MSDLYIDTPEGLAKLVDHLRTVEWFAFDTEFMRGATFYAQLCLMQVGTPDVVACIDALNIPDLSPFLDVLYDPKITKVVHSGSQDFEMFFEMKGKVPAPIFDTQVAALALGHSHQIGYAALVKEMLGIEVDKTQTRTDWTQRPLLPEQVKYAADDVRHLREIYLLLRTALEQGGRMEWVADDFAKLSDPATYLNEPYEIWRRIRGVERLEGRQLAIARGLAAWRELRARAIDRPRRWIMDDGVILELARATPRTLDELAQVRGVDQRTVQRRGRELLSIIAAALDETEEIWPVVEKHRLLSKGQEKLVAKMMAAVTETATRLKLHPSILATKRDVERLVVGERELPVLRGWRNSLVGERLDQMLAAKQSDAPEEAASEPADSSAS
jgi:ribonuclease D